MVHQSRETGLVEVRTFRSVVAATGIGTEMVGNFPDVGSFYTMRLAVAGPKIPDGADFAASGSGNDCHSVAAIDIFLERNRAFIISERSRSEIGFVVRLTDFGLHYVVLGNILRTR